jgi:sec-independent protein translocase protein TatC
MVCVTEFSCPPESLVVGGDPAVRAADGKIEPLQHQHRYAMEQHTSSDQLEKQALTEHLRELRSCLIISFAAVFVGFCLAYTVIRPIGTWFFNPLTEVLPKDTSLIFTSYQEGFFFI